MVRVHPVFCHTIVEGCVRARRQSTRAVFVPLHRPPRHAQVDFVDAVVVLRGRREKVAFFCLILRRSNVWSPKVYSWETTGAYLDGHVSAFIDLAEGPRSILYDNTFCTAARTMATSTRSNGSMPRSSAALTSSASPPRRHHHPPRRCRRPRAERRVGRLEEKHDAGIHRSRERQSDRQAVPVAA